ncbi:DUF3397 domain-containing protein [Peribacillus kribbensis]|uniref:DUF3397 domain-containing protein n=1 Tax=Peribacillus kribbensis TaxID=356658 RepID=UPI00042932D9|nr:DUF3397 domain-containing protein [Peribacillus kribbensis]
MATIVSILAATLITVPLISYIISFTVLKQITKNHRRSVQTSADITVLFLVLSVHYLIKVIWGVSFTGFLCIVLLAVAAAVTVMNYKYRKEIDFSRIFKGFLRMNFLFFFIAYVVLVLYGTIQRITVMLI